MKIVVSAFGVGFLFAVGLGISGMTRPENIQGFLDLLGEWKPQLALVMIAAVTVHFLLYLQIKRRPSPLFDLKFHIPTRKDINPKLIGGAAVFGVGWGMSGLCPGPAIVSLVTGNPSIFIFFASMLLGMYFGNRAK